VALLGLGSAIGLWRAVAGASSGPQRSGRVEVMLFEPLRPDADLRRFALVLGDSVVRLLSGAGVETTQRPRTRDTGGTDERSEFRIAGTVDRDGPRLVINAQLLERADGEVLWSERFVGASSAGMAAQDEAAGAIADTLECALSARSRSKTRISSTALSRMLNACRHRRDDPARFLALTRQLAQAAPDLSVAHSMYATAAAALLGDDASSDDKQALARTVRAEAARALALEPQNGEAYFALGLAMSQQRRWRQEEAYYVRAAELSPDLRLVDDHYVDTLREVGRLRDALSADQRAAANDPFSGDQLRSLALLLAATGQLPEAEAVIDRLDGIDPDLARDARFQAAFWWRDPQAARRNLRALAGRHAGRLACYEAYLARLASAHNVLRGLPSGCAGAPADWRIRMLARQGDVDGAYAEAAKAPPDALIAILFYPEMKAFRRDPRFMPLARSFGLVDYWRTSGHWPDFCAEPDLPNDCRKAAARL
jgi:Flp pilus assembly protein TadD